MKREWLKLLDAQGEEPRRKMVPRLICVLYSWLIAFFVIYAITILANLLTLMSLSLS